jgi:hypothetical protein|eukprot:COSAG01_NODE_3591_length_5899_cov_68.196034_3_plen_104_part_00
MAPAVVYAINLQSILARLPASSSCQAEAVSPSACILSDIVASCRCISTSVSAFDGVGCCLNHFAIASWNSVLCACASPVASIISFKVHPHGICQGKTVIRATR